MTTTGGPPGSTAFDEPELWRANLGAAFCDLVPGRLDHAPPPAGALRGGPLGEVTVFTVSGSPQTVRRTTTAVRHSPADMLKVCVALRGRATVHQDDREISLAPGQLGLYDIGRPYELRLEGRWTCAVMTVKRDQVALSGACLLAGTLTEAGDRVADSGSDAVRDQVTGYIRARLSDPRLSRGTVATEHHMSPRTLDRLFVGQAWSVSGYIRHERLEAVRRDLENPALRHRSVSALAARWCFFDAAHFSRLFRDAYGYPPSQARP
jgi:AraC-like DNA-binding protein